MVRFEKDCTFESAVCRPAVFVTYFLEEEERKKKKYKDRTGEQRE